MKAKDFDKLETNYYRIKNDPLVMLTLLHDQDKMPDILENMHVVELGNSKAEHVITLVTNPFCQPCATAHFDVENLMLHYNNIKVRIIFLACDGSNGLKHKIATDLMAVSLIKPEKLLHAFSSWYTMPDKQYSNWSYKGLSDTIDNSISVQNHCNWCQRSSIDKTPTVFVDGYKLPSMYKILDIKWILLER